MKRKSAHDRHRYLAVSASGGVFSLLLAYAMFFQNRLIVLLIPQIPLPAWMFVNLYAGMDMILGVTGTRGAFCAPWRHDRRLHGHPQLAPQWTQILSGSAEFLVGAPIYLCESGVLKL